MQKLISEEKGWKLKWSKKRKKVEEGRGKFVTAVRRPISTDANKTPKKAPVQARKSSLSTFQIWYASLISISPGRADKIIEARIAKGVKYKSLVNNSSDTSTVMAMTIFDTAVWHPALKFTAVLEKEPVKIYQKERQKFHICLWGCQRYSYIITWIFPSSYSGGIIDNENNTTHTDFSPQKYVNTLCWQDYLHSRWSPYSVLSII